MKTVNWRTEHPAIRFNFLGRAEVADLAQDPPAEHEMDAWFEVRKAYAHLKNEKHAADTTERKRFRGKVKTGII